MRAAVVLLVLALILLVRRVREKYSQPNSNYYRTKSGDRVCGDLKYTRGPDLEKCKTMCDQDKRCIGISWHPHKHCWLKGSKGDKHCSRPLSSGHHPNGYQYYYKGVDGFHAQSAGDRIGGNISVKHGVGVTDCGAECKKHKDCIGISYHSTWKGGTCIPKRDKGLSSDYHMNGWQYFARNSQNNNRADNGATVKNTNANNWGNGNTVYLDRHNVDCETEGLQGFKLYRPRWNQIAYNYQCSKTQNYNSRFNKATGWNAEGGGANIYLDRHNVNCGAHPLTRFKLQRNGRGRYRYDFQCARAKHKGGCRKAVTPMNDEGNFWNIYLDRHHPRCHNHEVMTQFKLGRQKNVGPNHPEGKFHYRYTCCKK